MVEKNGQEGETWALHEGHKSLTPGQPTVDGLLIVSDFALSQEDNKQVPMKQPLKPSLYRFQ